MIWRSSRRNVVYDFRIPHSDRLEELPPTCCRALEYPVGIDHLTRVKHTNVVILHGIRERKSSHRLQTENKHTPGSQSRIRSTFRLTVLGCGRNRPTSGDVLIFRSYGIAKIGHCFPFSPSFGVRVRYQICSEMGIDRHDSARRVIADPFPKPVVDMPSSPGNVEGTIASDCAVGIYQARPVELIDLEMKLGHHGLPRPHKKCLLAVSIGRRRHA